MIDLNNPLIRAAFEAGFSAGIGEGLAVEMGEAIGETEALEQGWTKFVQQNRTFAKGEMPEGYSIVDSEDHSSMLQFMRPDGTRSHASFGNNSTAILNAQEDSKGNRR